MVGTLRIRSFLIKMSSSECLNSVEVKDPSFLPLAVCRERTLLLTTKHQGGRKRNTLILFLGSKLIFLPDLQRRGKIIIVLLQLKPCCFGSHLPTLMFYSSKSSTLIPPARNPAKDSRHTALDTLKCAECAMTWLI